MRLAWRHFDRIVIATDVVGLFRFFFSYTAACVSNVQVYYLVAFRACASMHIRLSPRYIVDVVVVAFASGFCFFLFINAI